MPSEISQAEKGKYRVISLICGTWNAKQMNKQYKTKIIHTENRQVFVRWEGDWVMSIMGAGSQLCMVMDVN